MRSRNNPTRRHPSFFRVVSLRVPDRLGQVTQVMAIPIKRSDKRLVHYLNRDEVKTLLAAPDRTAWSARRDHALLLTLYNTGARVSEIIALRREQVQLDAAGAHVELLGKGTQGTGGAALGQDRPGAAGVVPRTRLRWQRRRVSRRPRSGVVTRRRRSPAPPRRRHSRPVRAWG